MNHTQSSHSAQRIRPPCCLCVLYFVTHSFVTCHVLRVPLLCFGPSVQRVRWEWWEMGGWIFLLPSRIISIIIAMVHLPKMGSCGDHWLSNTAPHAHELQKIITVNTTNRIRSGSGSGLISTQEYYSHEPSPHPL